MKPTYNPAGRPVGRSRGRARGTSPQQQPQPGHSAFGRPTTAPPVQQLQLVHAPSSVGRSIRARAPPYAAVAAAAAAAAEPIPVADAEGGLPGVGRGAMRGRVVVSAEGLSTRPPNTASKKGTSGLKLQLTANYFKILSKPDWCLYKYRVDFNPEENSTVVKKGLVRVHKEKLGSYIFDGTLLYSATMLTSQDQAMDLCSKRLSDDQIIRITIKFVGTLLKGDSHYIQFYNILARKCLENIELQLVGRNYFDSNAKIEIREFRFEIWPGYVTSIRQHESDVLMCAEINHKIMRQETILHVLDRIREEARNDYAATCTAEIVGLTVLTAYNNNTYCIDDIDFNARPTSTFVSRKDNQSITYKDYYRTKYGIHIRVDAQPLLVSRSRMSNRRSGDDEIIYLIPELCRTTGLTDAMRSNFRLMSTLAEYTRVSPQRRIEKLLNFNRRLHKDKGIVVELQNWKLSIENDLIKLPGRILNKECVIFGGGKNYPVAEDGDWTNRIKENSLFLSAALTQWFVVVPERVQRDAKNFIETVRKSIINGQMVEPRYIAIRHDSIRLYTDTLERAMSKQHPQLVVCVITKNRADIYSALKKMLCLDRPVPSQIITARCFNSRGLKSIATKVAIQLNCKLGGIPWTVRIPLSGLMVVGFDVCHDKNRRSLDFGAMVASLDKNQTRYFSAASVHANGEELSNHLTSNMIKALRSYQEVNNGAIPSHILFFRDGVGEGQEPFVVDHEVKSVRAVISKFYNQRDQVKLAYILVTKRLKTRLFHGNKNPLPGTVVDDVITNPLKYDFFLISQNVRQGSVTPTRYNVISDTTGLSPDQIQILTYKMTFVYFNCSHTMSVPAPVQFAHKLAFLISQSVHTPPTSPELQTLLYFL